MPEECRSQAQPLPRGVRQPSEKLTLHLANSCFGLRFHGAVARNPRGRNAMSAFAAKSVSEKQTHGAALYYCARRMTGLRRTAQGRLHGLRMMIAGMPELGQITGI